MEIEKQTPGVGWRYWANMGAASFLGGLTLGVVGGAFTGFLLWPSIHDLLFLQGFQAGLIGGASAGLLAGVIQWLGLRQGISTTRTWVLLSSAIGGVTWAIATGFSTVVVEIAGGNPRIIGNGALWAITGLVFGAVGGAVSGAQQRKLLLPEVYPSADSWLHICLVGWAAGGIVFLPAAWETVVGLIGGGNPGDSAIQAAGNNIVFCLPACIGFLALLPIWIIVQVLRKHKRHGNDLRTN